MNSILYTKPDDNRRRVAAGQDLLTCQRCGEVEPRVTETGPHLKATCPACGRFIRFLKQRDVDFLPAIRRFSSRMDSQQLVEAIRLLQEACDDC